MNASTQIDSSSSAVDAHSYLILHLERMTLLAESQKHAAASKRTPRISAGRNLWRMALIAVALLAAGAFMARAQSTFGSIRGTVQDNTGAVIPGATVTVHSLDQSLTRQVTSNDAGEFLVQIGRAHV